MILNVVTPVKIEHCNYIPRKYQGKSVSSDLLMSINELGAVAVTSRVQSI